MGEMFVALLVGILIGVVIILIMFILLHVTGNQDKRLFKPENEDISLEELADVVVNAIDDFKYKEKYDKEKSSFVHLGHELKEMTEEISNMYYPSSKYSPYEITLDEVLMLNKHFLDKIDEILNIPLVGKVRKMKLSVIIEKSKEKKEEELNHKKKSFLTKNNPIGYAKRLVVGTAVKKSTRYIFIRVIKLIGNELPKIYSKGLFQEDIELEIEEVLSNE